LNPEQAMTDKSSGMPEENITPDTPPYISAEYLEEYETRALSGDTDAMFALGIYYAHEDNFNYLMATKWLRMASKHHRIDAMIRLSQFLISQAREFKEAVQWLHQAVDTHKSIDAMMILGEIYQTESSGLKEIAKSELWYMKASKLGRIDAMYKLGVLSSEQDPRKKGQATIDWFKQAAKQGHAESMHALGVFYGRNDTFYQDLEKSCHWFLHASNAGYLDSLVPLGLLYMLNNGIITNYTVAYALFLLAYNEHKEDYKKKQAHQQAEILKQHMDQTEIDNATQLSTSLYPPGKLLIALNTYLSR
jgi:TPR repeat protein